jgi:hypothetical protein
MARGRLGAEQIVTKLQQIEVLQRQNKSVAAACKEAGTTEQTYVAWPAALHRPAPPATLAQPPALN